MNEIPNNIKNKVKDLNWSDTFIFEEMPCDHPVNAKDFEKINCNKCKFDKRESWLENTLLKQNSKETIDAFDKAGKPVTLTLKQINVIRGQFDDCIGISKEYE